MQSNSKTNQHQLTDGSIEEQVENKSNIDDETLLCELDQVSGDIERILLGSILESNLELQRKTLDRHLSGLVDVMWCW